MITIGYCTREIKQDFIETIKNTCGIDNPEIIPVLNNGDKSLTSVYNEIIRKASNDIICLIHDDLEFLSNNWGNTLINLLNNSDFGIIGVAGSSYFDATAAWWTYIGCTYGQVWHCKPNGQKYLTTFSEKFPLNTIKQTVCLDGIFIGFDRTKIKSTFNESIQGFHFYDIDFTIHNHLEGVKIGVTTDITLFHKSVGAISTNWQENKNQFNSIYNKNYPIYLV